MIDAHAGSVACNTNNKQISVVRVIILSANLRQDFNLNRIHLRTSLSLEMNDITIVSELCENFQEVSNQDSIASQ